MTSPTDRSVVCLLIHHCNSVCAHWTHDCVDVGILFFTFRIDSECFLFTISAIMSSCTFPISPSYTFLIRNSRYNAQPHDISHFGCISLVFKRHLWRRLFWSYRSWQGFPHKLIHYIYIRLTFLCRLLYSPSGNTNPYSSISSVARNPFWNSNVAWAYYSMDSLLGHQQSFRPPQEHQMRMSFQNSVPWYALIVWWMYWVCWVEAAMLGASKEAYIM